MTADRRIRIVVAILTAILVLAAITCLATRFLYDQSTDRCVWLPNPDGPGFLVLGVRPGGPADAAGIRDNDVLLEIDGQAFEQDVNAQAYIDGLDEGAACVYRMQRNGEEFEAEVVLEKAVTHQTILLGILTIVGILFIVTGTAVIRSNPMSRTSRLFYWFAVVFSLSMIFGGAPNTGILLKPIFDWLALSGATLLGPAFLHFYASFPRKPRYLERHRWLLPALYVPSILAMLTVVIVSNTFAPLFLLMMFAYVAAGLLVFTVRFFRLEDPTERRVLRVVLAGSYLGMLPLLVAILFQPLLIQLCGLTGLSILAGMMILLPISFGWAILRHGLMETTIIVEKSLIYSIVTAIFITLYALLIVGLGGVMPRRLGLESTTLNLVFLVLVALAFNPVKDRIQTVVDRRFFREQYDYRRTLLDLSRQLPTLIDMNRILSSVSSTLRETLHVQRLAICIRGADGSYRAVERFGMDEGEDVCDFSGAPDGLAAVLAGEQRCVSFLRPGDDPAAHRIVPEDLERIERLGVVTALPLTVGDRMTGFMILGPKRSGASLSHEDEDLLLTVAGQTAIALENARLHQDELRGERLRNEMQVAHRIQLELLPERAPDLPGLEVSGTYLPAEEVGGDYYDYVKLDDHRLLVFVGDVSGKGIPAALYMSKVQGMIQIAARSLAGPREILLEVNRRIAEGLERSSFITMYAVLFDLQAATLTACRAGHNLLLVWRRDGIVEEVGSSGLGLGLDEGELFEQKLEEVTVPFGPGDWCMLYSDGLTDAENAADEQFGIERLQSVLAHESFIDAGSCRDTVLRAAIDFRGDTPQNDDITLVVVRAV